VIFFPANFQSAAKNTDSVAACFAVIVFGSAVVVIGLVVGVVFRSQRCAMNTCEFANRQHLFCGIAKKLYTADMSTATALQFSEVTALNLKDLRTQKGMTQAQVADLIGLSHEQVSRIESGQRSLSPAEKMVLDARLLGLPL